MPENVNQFLHSLKNYDPSYERKQLLIIDGAGVMTSHQINMIYEIKKNNKRFFRYCSFWSKIPN